MFSILNDLFKLADESIALNRLNKVTRGYITADGYRFAVLPNGRISDGDITFKSEKEFISEVGITNYIQLKDSALIENIINIEKIRDIKNWLQMTAIQSDYKVLLIHDIDRMNINACNAFLKLLEEPIGQTVILLNTGKLSALPQTIISRCLKLKLRMNEATFEKAITSQNSNYNKADLQKVYISCDGNINIAKLLLKNDIYNDDTDNAIISKLEELDLKQQEQYTIFMHMAQKLLAKLTEQMVFKQNKYNSNFLKNVTYIETFTNNMGILNKNTIKPVILSLLKQCITS